MDLETEVTECVCASVRVCERACAHTCVHAHPRARAHTHTHMQVGKLRNQVLESETNHNNLQSQVSIHTCVRACVRMQSTPRTLAPMCRPVHPRERAPMCTRMQAHTHMHAHSSGPLVQFELE